MKRWPKLLNDAVSRRRDRWTAVGLLAGLLLGLVLTVGVAARSGDSSTLIHFAPPHTDVAEAPADVVVLPERRGYDGQFYWRLATDPLSTDERVDGVALDHPALRMTRIGYPVTARVVSEVSRGSIGVVDAMLLVNVVALGAIGACGVSIARRTGRHPAAGLALLGVPAFVYGTTMAVTDTLAGALVIGAIAAFGRDRLAIAAVLLSAAALTRETALILPFVGLTFVALRWRRTRPTEPLSWTLLSVAAAPVSAAAAWQVVVVSRWGEVGPLSSGGSNLGVPFTGPFRTAGFLSPSTGDEWLNLLAPAAALAVVGVAAVALWRKEPIALPPVLVAAFAVSVLVAVSIGPALLASYRNAVRGVGDASIFAVVIALHGAGRWSRLTLIGTVAVGAALALWELRIAADLT